MSIPVKISITYVFFSLIYIYLSDSIVTFITLDAGTLRLLQSLKGTAFVLTTGGILFFLTRQHSRTIEEHYASLINERLQSFNDLKRSEEKYWTVFNSSPIPMWIYDLNSLNFLLVNEAACKKYGYSREEFYRMTINHIRPEKDIPRRSVPGPERAPQSMGAPLYTLVQRWPQAERAYREQRNIV